MVLPALSISISHASFQAELEGAILQQTASVDYYLQTAAPKWSAESYQDDGCGPGGLRSLFMSDLNTSSFQCTYSQEQFSVVDSDNSHCRKRRPREQPLQVDTAGAQLEQFLEDDLHRFMELREQLDHQASVSDAAVLSSSMHEHRRRLSNGSSSGISFVKLPEDNPHDAADDDEDNESHPVAAALAAAAAMAVVNDMAASPRSAASSLLAATAAAAQQQHGSSSSGSSSSAAAAATESSLQVQAASSAAAAQHQFVMQPDEEIAAQKVAARVRLAELEQDSSGGMLQQQQELTADAAESKGFQKWCPDVNDADGGARAPGSMHSSKVPERPRGLAGLPHSRALNANQSLLHRVASRLYELSVANSEGVLLQHNQFLQHMLAGLVLCMVLLPVLWLLQADGGRGAGIVRSLLPATLLTRAEQLTNLLYMCSAVGVLMYCLGRSLLLQPPLLHFREPALERQYLLWSNSGRLFQDCLFQLTFLVVGSCLWLRLLQGALAEEDVSAAVISGRLVLSGLTLMGSGLPVLMLLLLRSPRYVEWREPLLAGSRLCSVLALSVLQLAAGPGGQLQLNMPFIALAQVMSIACMQVRLSSFVPSQVLHLLVLLLCTRALNPLLQFTQLFGGWLCLPCLVLYSMEMHSRKAFLATLAPAAAANGKVVS